jgi:integrase
MAWNETAKRHEGAPRPASWIETVTALEQLITKHIDQSQYFIIFDELDEDYRDIIDPSQYRQYTALITSFFKAVQDIKKIFSDKTKFKILPVIFLRDDIYEIIQDSDKKNGMISKLNSLGTKKKYRNLSHFG